ncbi:ornithine cyclodeaminase [Pelagibacterium sp. H642]|uniref:ornithine cyclodeaminase n=1 Tax=Pelagibacterium sp. H642 TaxID=1881069 RepID=UPI0028168896|nr:ornithine cyclodeaminase [Pelagibacterium sp. H642]WMT92562.1 ornithine cyclodeaminase [Pelagibacterium sp. H642]
MTPHLPPFMSWTELEAAGLDPNPVVLHGIAKRMWRDLHLGKTFGKKSVLHPREADLWQRDEFSQLRGAFGSERLGWKLSALSAIGPDYAAVKIVGANAINRHFGLARSASIVVLLDKFTMRPLCLFEGTGLSAARTGTYGSIVADAIFAERDPIKVFMFGGGPVARNIALSLWANYGKSIDAVWVKTQSLGTAQAFVRSLAHTDLPLMAVGDNARLAEADLVVTASNAKSPVFSANQPNARAVVLHLGGDETPASYLTQMLRHGTLVCDDVAMVSQRNSQSLSLLFSARGTSLETQGPLLGIAGLADLVEGSVPIERPVHITCVGLPSLDLYVAAYLYEALRAQRPARELSEHGS